MIRFAIKGLGTRKLRTGLTAIAIVLGVSLVTGTYILTDSIKGAFNGIFNEVYRGTDATITGQAAFDIPGDSSTEPPPFDESLLAAVRKLPDVDQAVGGVGGLAYLIGKNGKVIVFGGAPNLGFSVDPKSPDLNSLTLTEGNWPKAREVVVDRATAGKKDLNVGDRIGVQAEGPQIRMRIAGIVKFGGANSLGGATLAGFDLPTAQVLFQKEGKLDQVRAKAKPGVSPERLAGVISAILPDGTQVRTGEGQAEEDAKETQAFLDFLQTFLLAFGFIALFVGAFVIANSLSITIAQRTRELATLRTLGASRKQVLGSIVVEAIVMGILASITGILLGLGLATGLFELFDAVGFTLPNNGLVMQTRTIVVSLLVGVVVTLVASLRPALRATRVPPISAVREGATLPPGRFARWRTPWAIILTVLGFALLATGIWASSGTAQVLTFMGLGTLLIFFGVALLSARIARPFAWVLGWPAARIGGAAGSLARDNSRRNPQRTASTASALMIGLALVTLVSVLAAGITKTFRDAVDELWISGYAITAQQTFSPITPAAGEVAAKTPGVEAIANVRFGDASVFGDVIQASAVNPEAVGIFNMDWLDSGDDSVFAKLGADGAIVDDDYAKDHLLEIGSPFTLTSPNREVVELKVVGIFDPPTGGSPFGRVTISTAAWDKIYDQPQNYFSFVRMTGGETDANKAALERQLAEYPVAKVQTKQEFIDSQIGPLNAILNVLFVLLALSVVVSLFGIVNTLILTVFERTRELGMLRAVGMTRRQTRRMIRHESIITALMGGVIGIILGIVLGALLIVRVDEIDFSLPILQLVIFAIAIILVGIVAAIFPARRAAKLNVLEALQYE